MHIALILQTGFQKDNSWQSRILENKVSQNSVLLLFNKSSFSRFKKEEQIVRKGFVPGTEWEKVIIKQMGS